jgi:hypothetical protein
VAAATSSARSTRRPEASFTKCRYLSDADKRKHVEFAICVANEGYDDLEVWKVFSQTVWQPTPLQ